MFQNTHLHLISLVRKTPVGTPPLAFVSGTKCPRLYSASLYKHHGSEASEIVRAIPVVVPARLNDGLKDRRYQSLPLRSRPVLTRVAVHDHGSFLDLVGPQSQAARPCCIKVGIRIGEICSVDCEQIRNRW